jgi:hypothetical protein
MRIAAIAIVSGSAAAMPNKRFAISSQPARIRLPKVSKKPGPTREVVYRAPDRQRNPQVDRLGAGLPPDYRDKYLVPPSIIEGLSMSLRSGVLRGTR